MNSSIKIIEKSNNPNFKLSKKIIIKIDQVMIEKRFFEKAIDKHKIFHHAAVRVIEATPFFTILSQTIFLLKVHSTSLSIQKHHSRLGNYWGVPKINAHSVILCEKSFIIFGIENQMNIF